MDGRIPFRCFSPYIITRSLLFLIFYFLKPAKLLFYCYFNFKHLPALLFTSKQTFSIKHSVVLVSRNAVKLSVQFIHCATFNYDIILTSILLKKELQFHFDALENVVAELQRTNVE